jgi:hypothetical protein
MPRVETGKSSSRDAPGGSPHPHTWIALARELNPFVWIYFFLSFLELRSKLWVTGTWFDGTLERNHQALLAFQYTNNEQSRILQFYIPEFLVQAFGMSVPHAYLVQRWLFIGLSFVLFHLYLRRWFSKGLCFAAVCLLAAILPYSFLNDLQESSCLLMVTFVVALWTIRDGQAWSFAVALLVGAMNNETSLALPVVFFADRFCGWRPKELWSTAWRTLAVAAPAFAYTVWIRYLTRDRPHLGGAWHWNDNLEGLWGDLHLNVLDYPGAFYLGVFFIFNVLWVYAFLRFREKPKFIRATLLLIPAFLIPHMITGVIMEVRQMIPLGFVVIPAAMFWIFRDELSTDKTGVLER